MAEDWQFYFCNVNGKLATILLDLSLAERAPVREKPCLVWVWVYLRAPRPDGLSDSSEAPTLFEVEDKLSNQLRSSLGAILAGKITTNGRREFYYYTDNALKVEEDVRRGLEGFKGYKFECGSSSDPDWKHYWDVLHPSPEDMQKIQNRKVLDELRRRGDHPMATREVRHWVYFRTDVDRSNFLIEVARLGYRNDRVCDGTEPFRFGLLIARNQPTTEDAIDRSVLELFRVAQRYKAEYDGWETQVTVVN